VSENRISAKTADYQSDRRRYGPMIRDQRAVLDLLVGELGEVADAFGREVVLAKEPDLRVLLEVGACLNRKLLMSAVAAVWR
jgi:hypothetical protein